MIDAGEMAAAFASLADDEAAALRYVEAEICDAMVLGSLRRAGDLAREAALIRSRIEALGEARRELLRP